MAFRLAWATDTHLDHADESARTEFYENVRMSCPDALLITGDVSSATGLFPHLREVQAGVGDVPVYYVLGNHDYYGGSVKAVRERAASFHAEPGAERTLWLGASGPVMLGGKTALVGDDGWYDGRNGSFFRSDVELNDFWCVAELMTKDRQARLSRIKALADASADRLERLIAEAAATPGVEHVVVATHVPPWPGAAWHMGQVSDRHWQPFMSSRASGLSIESAAGLTDKSFTVLCGHSHSPGVHRPSQQITCETGQAAYRRPSLWKTFDL